MGVGACKQRQLPEPQGREHLSILERGSLDPVQVLVWFRVQKFKSLTLNLIGFW